MSLSWLRRCGYLLLVLAGLALCLPFLNSPLFFDDQYFFQPGVPEKFFVNGVHLYPRWWVHETFAVTYVLLGKKIFWLRLGNLLLHVATAIALMAFLSNLLRDIDRRVDLPIGPSLAAWLVACLFVVHPLAIFTQGYLIQRTILCATLFSLLSLLAFWRGLAGSRLALWGACLLFVLGVLAKEHAVMLPLAAALLVVLRVRSGLAIRQSMVAVGMALSVQALVALLVILRLKGVVGEPYEVMLAEVLEGESDIPQEHLYGLSVLNQAGLFFKYLGLWVLPNPQQIAVDIRQPFPLDYSSWSLWCGALVFVGYISAGVLLLWRGAARGLLGFSVLLPGVLYFTEFSTVRLQESFVLYRSYLWIPFLGGALALLLRRLSMRLGLLLVVLLMVVFSGFSYMRLKTFSSSLLVWREAADVYEGQPGREGVFGGYRIYYNLGTDLYGIGFVQLALEALNRAVELKPSYGWAHNNRGAVFLALKNYTAAQADYEAAIQLMPGKSVPWNGLVQVFEAQGKRELAEKAKQVECNLSRQASCGGVSPSIGASTNPLP